MQKVKEMVLKNFDAIDKHCAEYCQVNNSEIIDSIFVFELLKKSKLKLIEGDEIQNNIADRFNHTIDTLRQFITNEYIKTKQIELIFINNCIKACKEGIEKGFKS